MSSKGNPETHNDSAHASINTETSTKQSDNAASDETSTASNKGKSTKKTIDFSKLFADDPERNKKISIATIIILILIVCILCAEIYISIIHLEEVQKLIKAPENTPSEILEAINNIRNIFSLLGLILIILIIAFTSCFTKMIMDFLNKYPQRVFVVTVSLGGVLAFSIPQYLYSFKFIGETKDITTSLLTVTGGILAVFTLLKTHQKSELEREQLDTQKEKDQRDHDRQVHAERRSRYAKAIEQLADEKAAIRLGGIYTLVGLVDEWLTDKDIKDINIRHEEGQVIINNLCAYIRSPFPLADKIDEYKAHEEIEERKEKDSRHKLSEYESERFKTVLKYLTIPNEYKKPEDITADYAKFHEEQDVRRTIFDEIHKRSSNISKDERGKVVETSPGPWSAFEFDFSRAPIFYSLNDLKIEKGNFSNAKLYADASFTGSDFVSDANFSNATFSNNAYFNKVAFSKATFISRAEFNHVKFTWADFDNVTFAGYAEFDAVEFTQHASFSKATFDNTVRFRYLAEFIGNVNFSEAVFTSEADFTRATFIQKADFSKATFAQKVNFNSVIFKSSAPTFVKGNLRAQFSIHSAQEDLFSLHSNSKPIPPGVAELDEVKRQIPVGTVLFDPASKKDESGNYKQSEPAKPIEESDNQGETPSE